jgi:SAM-dependent methyltransferase
MATELQNFLYRHPDLYEAVYCRSAGNVQNMCKMLFSRHRKSPPCTVLDMGCGTGYDLAYFNDEGYRCTGVDYQRKMINYARTRYSGIDFRVGDLRTIRLGQTFDVIICLGWVLAYVNSNEELSLAMDTFAVHSKPDTLLILEIHNPIGDLGLGLRRNFVIDTDKLTASAQATYTVDRRNQMLIRQRTWLIPGQPSQEDLARYRLFFPMEIQHHLNTHGFSVSGMYDNTQLANSDLSGSALYVAAHAGDARARLDHLHGAADSW